MNRFEKVKELVAMADIIHHFNLTTNRAGYICCPFHKERTPSLKVYKNDFNCFGCGVGGDIITFTQKMLNITPYEAMEYLAKQFNIDIGENTLSILQKRQLDLKKRQVEQEEEIEFLKKQWYNKLAEQHCNLWHCLNKVAENSEELLWELAERFGKISLLLNWIETDFESFYLAKGENI